MGGNIDVKSLNGLEKAWVNHQLQVDWVEFPKDNLSAFVATMGYSRASYVEYVENEKIETLIACHLNAFNPDYAIGKFQSKQTYYKI